MPEASFEMVATAKVEVWCGNCDRRRLPPDHPRAVVCDCGKTIESNTTPDGEG